MTNPIELTSPEPRPRRTVAVLWVSIIALFAAALFGALTVREDETAAASTEPEGAVRKLLSAVADSDLLGVLDSLLPSERDLLRDPIIDLANEAERLGILSDALSLERISGVDIAFRNVTFATTNLADGIASVRVTGGTISTRTVFRELPLGELFDSVGRPEGEEEMTEPISEPDAEVVTVREDGRWYVSLAYSIAEGARRSAAAPLPEFGRGLQARGEATPQAAAEAALRAGLDLNVERLFTLISPSEGRALRDYAPLFLDGFKMAANDAKSSFSARLSDLRTETKVSGNRGQVVLKGFRIQFLAGGEQGEVVLDGTCATVTLAGQGPIRSCAEEGREAFPFLQDGALPESGIAVINEDGAWYVSPTRTITDAIISFGRAMSRDGLEDLVRQFTGTMAT